MAEKTPATWQDVSDALAALETRQASFRCQLGALQQRAQSSSRQGQIQKLQLNFAARVVQLQRQGEILRSQTTRACRQAVRSRSLAAQAQRASKAAQLESQELRGALQGLGDALDAKTREAASCRREAQALRQQLQQRERRSAANDGRLQKQEELLEEAASALSGLLSKKLEDYEDPDLLAITDGPLLAAIADESIAKLPMLNAQDLSNTLWAMAKLEMAHLPLLDAAGSRAQGFRWISSQLNR